MATQAIMAMTIKIDPIAIRKLIGFPIILY
jgi:hypothetical protein